MEQESANGGSDLEPERVIVCMESELLLLTPPENTLFVSSTEGLVVKLGPEESWLLTCSLEETLSILLLYPELLRRASSFSLPTAPIVVESGTHSPLSPSPTPSNPTTLEDGRTLSSSRLPSLGSRDPSRFLSCGGTLALGPPGGQVVDEGSLEEGSVGGLVISTITCSSGDFSSGGRLSPLNGLTSFPSSLGIGKGS